MSNPQDLLRPAITVGAHVVKEGGDYQYEGIVVCVFEKTSGHWRLVVENRDGMLFIFNEQQLRVVT